MAQPIATIAKAECEAEAKLPEDSASSTIAAAASPIGLPGETIKSIPTLRRSGVTGDEFTDPILDTPTRGQSSPLVPELPPNKPLTTPAIGEVAMPRMAPEIAGSNIDAPPARASPVQPLNVQTVDASTERLQPRALVPELPASLTAPAIADIAMPRMAPGIGGFNIHPPAPKASPVQRDVAVDDIRARRLLNSELVASPPIQPRMGIAGLDESSLVFNLLTVIALVGLTLLALRGDPGKQVHDQSPAAIPMHEGLPGAATSAHPALVVTQSQKGFANEPLPLGVWVKDGSGGETVTIAGLAKGTDLSLGTPQGAAGWLLSARDLDKTFVGPPKNFVGVMDAKVELSSARGQLLDSQVIRLEWIEKTEEGLLPALAPADPTAVVPPLNSEQIAALIKLAEDLLGHSDIATARLLLERAAIAGNAQAALELGLTFDQSFLALSGTLRVSPPDTAQARAWYERALKLGSTEASRHLQQLANTPK
jgi:hypothetical protein